MVFLSGDHGRPDRTRYGATGIETPHTLRLVDPVMPFTNACIVPATCMTSRTAMLTGLMPSRLET